MLGSNAWLIIAGAVFIAVGILLRRWSAQRDLKGAAIDSAWSIALGRRTADNPTAIEAKLRDIQAQPTWTGKATRTVGTAVAQPSGAGCSCRGAGPHPRRIGAGRRRLLLALTGGPIRAPLKPEP